MKNTVLLTAVAAIAGSFGSAAMAQEVGRVISSTPVVQQVGVPRQVCSNQPVAVSQPKSGAGALMGALAGGGLGNAVGQGGGRALATVVGVMGGAILGNNIEGSNTQVQNVQQCSTQTFYENRTMGYNVVYEFSGKQYSVQMPNDPGPTVQLQVTPVGAGNYPPPMNIQPQPGMVNQPMTYVQPPISSTTVIQPAYGYVSPSVVSPVVYAPSYYSPSYYPPVGISLGFGYRGGYYGGGGHHWR